VSFITDDAGRYAGRPRCGPDDRHEGATDARAVLPALVAAGGPAGRARLGYRCPPALRPRAGRLPLQEPLPRRPRRDIAAVAAPPHPRPVGARCAARAVGRPGTTHGGAGRLRYRPRAAAHLPAGGQRTGRRPGGAHAGARRRAGGRGGRPQQGPDGAGGAVPRRRDLGTARMRGTAVYPARPVRHHATTPLRIAVVAPPWYELPPEGYGGIEAVCATLVDQLVDNGHDVTVFGVGRRCGTAGRFVSLIAEPQYLRLGEAMPAALYAARVKQALSDGDFD